MQDESCGRSKGPKGDVLRDLDSLCPGARRHTVATGSPRDRGRILGGAVALQEPEPSPAAAPPWLSPSGFPAPLPPRRDAGMSLASCPVEQATPARAAAPR